jgi:hypothetical protein
MPRRLSRAGIRAVAGLGLLALAALPGRSAGQATPGSLRLKTVSGNMQLHGTITVELDSLLPFLQDTGRDAAKFVLYLDHRPLKGLGVRAIPGTNQLQFDLERSADSKDTWDRLMGSPLDKGFSYLVPVSVGYAGEAALRSQVRYALRIIRPFGFWIYVGAFLVVFLVFLGLARKTQIIRDARGDVPADKLPPYSLGKSQMAFWLFLVLASFLLILLVTGDSPTLTESVLALMGISAGTALSSVVITNSKAEDTQKQIQDLMTQRVTLDGRSKAIAAEIAAGNVAGKALNDLQDEKTKTDARIQKIDKALNQESEGFWKDVLTDVDGISLHRFQIVIWTVVLGLIFLFKAYRSLGMPEFPPTLVALMGISAGTYIGFKFPEKQV